MSKHGGRLRATVLPIAFAAAFGLVAAAPAAAVDVPATCADLQAKLDAAQDGDVIVLSGICTDQYTLPSFATPGPAESYKRVTLRGEPSDGEEDGFDRTGLRGGRSPGTMSTGLLSTTSSSATARWSAEMAERLP